MLVAALAGCGMMSKLSGADKKAEEEARKYANLTQRATGDVKGVIDHLFWRLVLLVVIVIVLTVIAILAYRLIAHRVLPGHARAVVVEERKRA